MATQPDDELPLSADDPNNPARQKALTTALGGGPSTPDPFAAMGGGVYENGGWKPNNMSSLPGPASQPAQPASQPASAPTAESGPDPFAAMGGGVMVNGGWVPANHPAAAGAPSSPTAGAGSAAAPGAAGNATPNTIQGAYNNALQNLLTGPSPQEAGADVANSPAVKAYNEQRLHQEGIDRATLAERNAASGLSGSGGADTGILGLRQAATRDMGSYAGEQASKAEAGRRQELLAALATAQAMGDTASQQALQRELAQLSHAEFEDQLGFNISDRQQYYNQAALEALLGGASGPGTGQ